MQVKFKFNSDLIIFSRFMSLLQKKKLWFPLIIYHVWNFPIEIENIDVSWEYAGRVWSWFWSMQLCSAQLCPLDLCNFGLRKFLMCPTFQLCYPCGAICVRYIDTFLVMHLHVIILGILIVLGQEWNKLSLCSSPSICLSVPIFICHAFAWNTSCSEFLSFVNFKPHQNF